MLNKIFTIISYNVKFKASPHMFRHYFSERMLQFLIEIKKLLSSVTQIILVNFLEGWSK